MSDEQSSLGQFGVEVPEEEGETPGGSAEEDGAQIRYDTIAYQTMAPNADPQGRYSCPWCCAPPSEFTVNSLGQTGCGHCDAVIPIDASWYHEGEKVII